MKIFDLQVYNRSMLLSSLFNSLSSSFQATFFPAHESFIYVALGDSVAEGKGASAHQRSYTGIIHETLKEARKNVKYYNLAKDGAKIQHVLLYQLEKAISLQPDFITISIGANDVRGITRVTTFKRSLETLFYHLRTQTNATIVMNTIPDISVTPRIPKHVKPISRLMVQRLNRVIEQCAKEYNIILVDMFEQVRVYARTHPEIVGDDGFHPSDFGYAMFAQTILSEIQDIIFPKKKELSYSYNYHK